MPGVFAGDPPSGVGSFAASRAQPGFQGKPAGSWATLALEQIDDMYDYYALYLPQMALAVCVPLLIVAAIFPSNWAAALSSAGHRPLILYLWRWWGWARLTPTAEALLRRLPGWRPFFLTVCAGWKLARISVVEAEPRAFRAASQDFRRRTMEVLRLAHLPACWSFHLAFYCAGRRLF